jgi:CheY-like chemotaxis protein
MSKIFRRLFKKKAAVSIIKETKDESIDKPLENSIKEESTGVEIKNKKKRANVKRYPHLVVDDNNFNRFVLRKFLEMKGIKVVELGDGQQAVNYITADKNIDCVWMDLKMPVMDGISATKILRAIGYENMIIGVTGNVESQSIVECKNAGMNITLPKPILKNVLFGLLEEYKLI